MSKKTVVRIDRQTAKDVITGVEIAIETAHDEGGKIHELPIDRAKMMDAIKAEIERQHPGYDVQLTGASS